MPRRPPRARINHDDNAYPMLYARDQLSQLVDRALFEKKRIRITCYGKVVAAIVSREDLALLEFMDRFEHVATLASSFAAMAEQLLETIKGDALQSMQRTLRPVSTHGGPTNAERTGKK